MAAIFGNRNFFWRIEQSIFHIYPLGQKFRRNRSTSHGLGDTSNLSFTIFVKNSKIQNSCHFWKEENFLKNGQSIFHIYPASQKIHRNCSISHGLGDTSNFKFYHFCQKFENSKWLPFLDRGNFFWKMCRVSCFDTLWAKNFAKIIICELFVMNTTWVHCVATNQSADL